MINAYVEETVSKYKDIERKLTETVKRMVAVDYPLRVVTDVDIQPKLVKITAVMKMASKKNIKENKPRGTVIVVAYSMPTILNAMGIKL